VDKENKVGENTFLKLREEKQKIKEELEQVKLQRDIALRKLKKASTAIKDLRKLVEYDNQTT
tara:strand:- start:557 stop:742 length:186 start_codon:yes stop_codon:yes gene_type:complete